MATINITDEGGIAAVGYVEDVMAGEHDTLLKSIHGNNPSASYEQKIRDDRLKALVCRDSCNIWHSPNSF